MPLSIPTRVSVDKLLVAIDFSRCSEAVLPYARSLAQQYDSTLFLVHVISPEVLALDPSAAETAHAQAERLMEDLKTSGQLEGVRYKRILGEGETWEGLNRLIEEEGIALLIVGTHGRTGLKKLVLGSVAESIFRRSPRPVLTIGPRVSAEARREARIGRILFATDLKPDSAAPALYAASLAHDHGASLTMLHVVEKGQPVPEPHELLDLLPEDLALLHAPEPLIETGDPVDVVVNKSASLDADLIVMGARRQTRRAAHFTDVPYSVMCEAPCPVLTVGMERRAQASPKPEGSK
jgi:nucleotide-binding universal stress UspA family protein